MRNHSFLQRALFFVAYALFAPSSFGSDNGPETLLIRPGKMESILNQDRDPLNRDPFNWSQKQVTRFKDSDKEKRARIFAGLQLTGIIWDTKRPVAIINGTMITLGDTIKGAKVKKISKESVLLRKNGVYYTLEFESSILGLKPGK